VSARNARDVSRFPKKRKKKYLDQVTGRAEQPARLHEFGVSAHVGSWNFRPRTGEKSIGRLQRLSPSGESVDIAPAAVSSFCAHDQGQSAAASARGTRRVMPTM
jgi:hypothetical protein